MLDVKNLSKTIGDKILLNNISFSVGKGVTALVGENGAGKSTLFRIIAGEIEQDSGSVNTNGAIGYLPQQISFQDLTVNEFISGTGKADYEVETMFEQLGLKHLNIQQKADNLSGGEKTKLYLAYLLLADPLPSMLLLDEPTNNLDLESILWLEDFITNFTGPVLLTSHDRAFLDEIADTILELKAGRIRQYGGNYSFYREQKLIEEEAYARMYKVQQKKIAEIEEDINTIRSKTLQGEKKFGSGDPYQRRKIRKAAEQGAARWRKLEKFLRSEKRLEKPEDRSVYPFSFQGAIHADKFLIGMKNVSKTFNGRKILNDLNFSLNGNLHVWLSGANGSGKSTVLKLLTGQEAADSGVIETGSSVKIGYFSQDIVTNEKTATVVEELMALGASQTDVFKFGKFLHLEKEDMVKPLNKLSRGQITKVEFIKLMMGNNHLLILDEPTNHLEIETREQIEEALRYYEGAVLVASHDRYFLERIGIDRQLDLREGNIIEEAVY